MRALTFSVLRMLSARDFLSGQALADRLDVSRASVWGAINEAQSAGIGVERVHGRGYRLLEPLDWLDAQRLNREVAGTGLTIEVMDCCRSTNAALLELADGGLVNRHVLAAELQTHGRGRLGRAWRSGLANALTFSLLWRFGKGISALAGLSLAVGIAIARSLRRGEVAAQLKWPNDISWQGCKLGGVLIEVRGDALGPCTAVIGIGLNVRLGAAARGHIEQPVADLAETGVTQLSRNHWLATIAAELAAMLNAFEVSGFEPLREEWIRFSAHQDKRVSLALPDGRQVLGIARGVDAQGRLLVDSRGMLGAYLSADISMRAVNDPCS